MSVIDALIAQNEEFAGSLSERHLDVRPSRELAIVTCMDSRLDVFAALGLGNGEAHVLRNAGGVITDDVIRSLAISQRLLGTREVMLIHHTRLRHGEDQRRRLPRRAAASRPASPPPSRSSPSATSRPTCANRSCACGAPPSYPTATRCAASSTTSTTTACARSSPTSPYSLARKATICGVWPAAAATPAGAIRVSPSSITPELVPAGSFSRQTTCPVLASKAESVPS